MSRLYCLAVILLLPLVVPISSLAQQTYGPELGRLYLSFDEANDVPCATFGSGQVFRIYVMADIDFADVADSGRNLTDGLSAVEFRVDWDPTDLTLVGSNSPISSAVNLGNSDPGFEEIILGLGECVPVGNGPTVVWEFSFITFSPIPERSFTLSPITDSSFAGAPTGDAAGWVECLPFGEVRFPFADTGDAVLNPSAAGTTTDLQPTSLTLGTVNECTTFQAQYTIEENELCAPSSTFEFQFWMSADATIDGTDELLATGTLQNGLGPSGIFNGIANNLTVPNVGLPDDVYLGLVVDTGGALAETDETNNTLVVGPFPLTGHRIRSITDVGGDQGLQVRINFRRSEFDVPGAAEDIVQYEVFRRIDPGLKAPPMQVSASQVSDKTVGYEFVGAVPAHGAPEYNVTVPTVSDQVPTGFFVRAATPDPFVYFDSCEIEGTSVDNLAPPSPAPFAVTYAASGNDLGWGDVDVADLVGFRVYRSSDPGFVPGPTTLVHTTSNLAWFDATPDPFGQHYKVTAFDDGGNESDAVDPTTVTGTETDTAPRTFALRDNVPNPFNPATTIHFDVPAQAGKFRVDVYDLAGRLVQTLFAGVLPAGTHQVQWNGTDRGGQRVGSGAYLVRMVAPDFEATRKVTLLK